MRILLTETVDPDGALCRWLSPDLQALGHQVTIVPAQETVHYLGVSGWQRLLCEIGVRWRPDLILVHPPYDHLNFETGRLLRRGGARLVAFAFDDALFLEAWRRTGAIDEILYAYQDLFDAYFTTCRAMGEVAEASGVERVRYLRWALSALSEGEAKAPIPARAVLVGRAYPGRVALLKALADAAIPVVVRGHGWEAVELPEAVDRGAYASAEEQRSLMRQGVAISPADWEEQSAPMVKARVLEAAFAGACQVAGECRELADYFSPAEVMGYASTEALIGHLRRLLGDGEIRQRMAAAARARALREHTWRARFDELLQALAQMARAPGDSPPRELDCTAYALTLQQLATTAEFAQRYAAAEAYYGLAAAAGAGVSAELGRRRCQLHLQRPEEAARGLRDLRMALRDSVHPGQRHLRARLSSPAVGAGLGVNRFIDPQVEALAYWLTAQVRCARIDQALRALEAIEDADTLVQLASLLAPEAYGEVFWQALAQAALAAQPVQLGALQAEQAPRWRAYLRRHRATGGRR